MLNDNIINGTANLLGGVSFILPSALAFGSTESILAEDDTETLGEFDRNLLTATTVTNNLVKYIGLRSSAEANNEVINVISLVNNDTLRNTGDICANMLVSSLIHSTDFDVGVEFWININRG